MCTTGMPNALRTCSTRSLRSQRERGPGWVEITIRSASKRSRASRTAANGTMSPTSPSHSRPSPRRTPSVRSSRPCAASIAPAWFQESPRLCSAATAGATTKKVELCSSSIRRSSASSSSASMVSFATTSTRVMRHLREDCAADATTASRIALKSLLDLAHGERGDGEHDAADQTPDLEREAVDALRHEHEHERADDPETDDPHRDLAELFFHVNPPSTTAHMLSRTLATGALDLQTALLEVRDDLRTMVALDLDDAVDHAPAGAAQALELAREPARLGRRSAADRRHGLALATRGLPSHTQDSVTRGAARLYAAGAAPAVRKWLAAVLTLPHPTAVRRVDQAHRRPR